MYTLYVYIILMIHTQLTNNLKVKHGSIFNWIVYNMGRYLNNIGDR